MLCSAGSVYTLLKEAINLIVQDLDQDKHWNGHNRNEHDI